MRTLRRILLTRARSSSTDGPAVEPTGACGDGDGVGVASVGDGEGVGVASVGDGEGVGVLSVGDGEGVGVVASPSVGAVVVARMAAASAALAVLRRWFE